MPELSDKMLSAEAALDTVSEVIAAARKRGAPAVEAAISAGEGLTVTVRNGELETIEHHRDKVLSVTIYDAGRKGSASTTDFGRDSLAQTVAAAARIAGHAQADHYAGLVEARHMATAIAALDLDHPWPLSAEEATAIGRECAAAAAADNRWIKQVDAATVSRHRGFVAYANSHGFAGAYPGTRHGISCVAVGERDGEMQRGYWFTVARSPAALEDARAVGSHAAQRTAARLGARKLATTTVPVLFEAPAAASLIGHFVGAVSGSSLYRKASFLLDAAGTEVFSTAVTIDEQPHLQRGLGSAPFDQDGVATRARTLVERGVLQGYVLDGYAARRLGLEPTGNAGGVHNLHVRAQAGGGFESLLRAMHKGLVVTELMGFGVNLVTGDYSRGASGFWVEDGVIQYPVEEITVAGNLRDIFRRIVATGEDLDLRGNICSGSLLVESMTVAGA